MWKALLDRGLRFKGQLNGQPLKGLPGTLRSWLGGTGRELLLPRALLG